MKSLKKGLLRVVPCLLMLAVLWSGQVSAHHSFAHFDMARTVAITGKVTKWVWVNPHSWVYMDVTRADGTTLTWAFECSSPNMMIRWGWRYADIRIGDTLTIDTHPARDGSPQGSVFAVYLADGRVLADPMGRRVSGDELAKGPPAVPSKPTGEPYR
jgi:Family of unknown function (DUF6152)